MSDQKAALSKRAAELNARLLRALGNPERQRILVVLSERPATPTELHEELDTDRRVTARHCRIMCEEGLIELIETDRRRGGKQHVYRAAVRPYLSLEMWEKLPKIVREMHSASILQDGVDDLAAAMADGSFDSVVNNANVRTPLVVDDEGMTKIARAMEELSGFLLEVQAESSARLLASGGEGMNVDSWLLAYPSARVPNR